MDSAPDGEGSSLGAPDVGLADETEAVAHSTVSPEQARQATYVRARPSRHVCPKTLC